MIIPYSNFSILQVGCGGTGGYLVPKIARLLMTLQKYRDGWQGYNIVDFDVVEEINLYRQNFVKADLGLYKSEVMAKRYGSHFGVAIGSGTEKAESWEEIFNFFPECNSGPVCRILIGCVDNNRARKVMHEAFINSDKPIIYIDSGNGKYTGQIVVGYKDTEIKLTPVGEVFPDSLVEVENAQPQNCALNALENPQNVGANDMAATLLFSVLNIILTDGEVNSHIIVFDAKKGFARTDAA